MDISLTSGRIYRRTNNHGIGLLGVVEVPDELQTEGVHACAFRAGALMVDKAEANTVLDSVQEELRPGYVKEMGANSFFYNSYASDSAGGQEFFFRETVLPSSTPGMKWCYITGARRLALDSLSKDGLYELGAKMRNIPLPEGFGLGVELGGLLREPIWGPAGAYGLGHTLEPGFFPAWALQEREANARRDPQFARYMQAMAKYGEAPLYFTAAQRAEQDALADKVLRELLDEEDGQYSRPRA